MTYTKFILGVASLLLIALVGGTILISNRDDINIAIIEPSKAPSLDNRVDVEFTDRDVYNKEVDFKGYSTGGAEVNQRVNNTYNLRNPE